MLTPNRKKEINLKGDKVGRESLFYRKAFAKRFVLDCLKFSQSFNCCHGQ